MAEKISIGMAVYGQQSAAFWAPLAMMCGTLHKNDIDLQGIHIAGSMATDHNRNDVVKHFLETKSDWLLWVDCDNVIPLGGVRRLLNMNKTLATGLYYLKAPPYTPVAYTREKSNNKYTPINGWTRGEILPVDMAGMGCCLTHRSVYEDIQKNTVVLDAYDGHAVVMHKDDVSGDIPNQMQDFGSQVITGILRTPVYKPLKDYENYPYFMTTFLRTEDVHFWEIAQRCGHSGWVDTSVEVPHIGSSEYCGETYRNHIKKSKAEVKGVRETVYVEGEEYTL